MSSHPESADAVAAQNFYRAIREQPLKALPLRAADEAILADAQTFRFGPGNSLVGWRFGSGGRPVAALVHGWGGQGTQFLRMAKALAESSFDTIIFDVGNHGSSRAASMGFDRFMDDAQALADHLGAMPFAWVAHSAAALAIMSARRTHGIGGEAFVTIAAPFLPYVPLNSLRSVGASEAVIDQVKPMLAAEFEADWDALEGGIAWSPQYDAKLLAIYDADDCMVQASDAARIRAIWPECELMQSDGFGHNRVLGAKPVIDAAVAFLAEVLGASKHCV